VVRARDREAEAAVQTHGRPTVPHPPALRALQHQLFYGDGFSVALNRRYRAAIDQMLRARDGTRPR
jgi:hypothetical protein